MPPRRPASPSATPSGDRQVRRHGRAHPVGGRVREHEREPEGLDPGLRRQAGQPVGHADRHRVRQGEHDAEREHDPQGERDAATPTPDGTPATVTYGDASKVNAATMKLFNKLVCTPGPNPTTVDDNWKKTVGYTDAGDQWDDLTSQTVSCDPSGTKYVLGPAVFEGTQLTGVTAALQPNSTQWVVNLTLNSEATKAFGTLTTNQYNNYFPGASTNQDDAALDSTAIVLDGNVQSAPETQGALTSGSVHDQRPAAERLHRGPGDPAHQRPQVRAAAAELHAAER